MIDLKKAQALILGATPVLGRESVPLLDALNRVLAQDIMAVEDLPAVDISAFDGYAVRHCSLTDETAKNITQRIIGESPAGKPCGAIVRPGEAVRIMTGGLIPKGADTVVKIEETVEQDGTVTCINVPKRGEGIRLRGDSVRKGDIVLRSGDYITPMEIGALAGMRRAYVYVHRKPIVAILSTGDELSDFHEPFSDAKAMCTNLYALAAQVADANAQPLLLGIVADDLEEQQAILNEALCADVIITSGGTSRGKYDLVQKTLAALGMEIRFSNLFAKPGKPTTFGTLQNRLIFGLPGNPTATMLSFAQFIKPALFKMMGRKSDTPRRNGGLCEADGPLCEIDSFNSAHGGNKDHARAYQIPLKKKPDRNYLHNEENKTAIAELDRLKIKAK